MSTCKTSVILLEPKKIIIAWFLLSLCNKKTFNHIVSMMRTAKEIRYIRLSVILGLFTRSKKLLTAHRLSTLRVLAASKQPPGGCLGLLRGWLQAANSLFKLNCMSISFKSYRKHCHSQSLFQKNWRQQNNFVYLQKHKSNVGSKEFKHYILSTLYYVTRLFL